MIRQVRIVRLRRCRFQRLALAFACRLQVRRSRVAERDNGLDLRRHLALNQAESRHHFHLALVAFDGRLDGSLPFNRADSRDATFAILVEVAEAPVSSVLVEPLTLRDDDPCNRCTGRKRDCLPSW